MTQPTNQVQEVIDRIKKQGIFDRFRKECLSDVDMKPSYQNLKNRVEGFVGKFLSNITWNSSLSKNIVRENLRKQLTSSNLLSSGVNRVIEQVVQPKINGSFKDEIDRIICAELGVDHEKRNKRLMQQKFWKEKQKNASPMNQGSRLIGAMNEKGGLMPYYPHSPYTQQSPYRLNYMPFSAGIMIPHVTPNPTPPKPTPPLSVDDLLNVPLPPKEEVVKPPEPEPQVEETIVTDSISEVVMPSEPEPPMKNYHFPWATQEPDLSDVTISSIHTSDLSSFEESDEDMSTSPSKVTRSPIKSGIVIPSQYYNDSESEPSAEDWKLRVDREKKERMEKRQKRRAVIEKKKNTPVDSPEKRSAKRKTIQMLKNELREQKVEHKRASLRRTRNRNPKYMSDEFTSIFTDKQQLISNEGYVEEEVVTEETLVPMQSNISSMRVGIEDSDGNSSSTRGRSPDSGSSVITARDESLSSRSSSFSRSRSRSLTRSDQVTSDEAERSPAHSSYLSNYNDSHTSPRTNLVNSPRSSEAPRMSNKLTHGLRDKGQRYDQSDLYKPRSSFARRQRSRDSPQKCALSKASNSSIGTSPSPSPRSRSPAKFQSRNASPKLHLPRDSPPRNHRSKSPLNKKKRCNDSSLRKYPGSPVSTEESIPRSTPLRKSSPAHAEESFYNYEDYNNYDTSYDESRDSTEGRHYSKSYSRSDRRSKYESRLSDNVRYADNDLRDVRRPNCSSGQRSNYLVPPKAIAAWTPSNAEISDEDESDSPVAETADDVWRSKYRPKKQVTPPKKGNSRSQSEEDGEVLSSSSEDGKVNPSGERSRWKKSPPVTRALRRKSEHEAAPIAKRLRR